MSNPKPPISGQSPLQIPQPLCFDCSSRMRVVVDGELGKKPRGFKLYCDYCERAHYAHGDHLNVMPQKYEAAPPEPPPTPGSCGCRCPAPLMNAVIGPEPVQFAPLPELPKAVLEATEHLRQQVDNATGGAPQEMKS